ncbi:MAG: chromosome condensation regulator [Candidatus Saccharibacteria bacterium]|nr:chromosome condensation regulator [Candidatus Saccharibacteria bacterium]
MQSNNGYSTMNPHMVHRLMKQGYQLISTHARKLNGASGGFLLPVVILLGVGVGTVSVVALSSVSQNSVTLNDQYYGSIAREAAQAGISAALSCKTAGDIRWSTSHLTLTPQTGCDGVNIGSKTATVATDAAFDSTYVVKELEQPNTTSMLVTSTGKVTVKGPGGIAVKTISKNVRTFAQIGAPSMARDLKDADEISTGSSTACAISTGWAYCWGSNDYNMLGTGINYAGNRTSSPKAVAQTAINADPGVCSWYQWWGACGGWNPNPWPAQPANAMIGSTVKKISVGATHVCAVANDLSGVGKAYCWGNNSSGQLGNNSVTASSVPTAVDVSALSALNGKSVTDISAGANFTCAIFDGGNVACWGANDNGQLGTNDRTASLVPKAVYRHDYIAATPGSPADPGVCAWYQWWGACGGYSVPPVAAVDPTPAVAASPFWTGKAVKLAVLKGNGAQTMCAIMDTTKTACWGQNYAGQTGNGQNATGATVSSTCTGGSVNPPAPAISTAVDVLQPNEVSTTLPFDSLVITGVITSSDVQSGYVTAKTTSTSSSNPNRIYYWGGATSVARPARTVCSGGGGSGAGNNGYLATTSRNYAAQSTPAGPSYNGTSGQNFDQKQIAISSGDVRGLFCGQAGGVLYCDTHSGDQSLGQPGSNEVPNCYPVWYGTQCDPIPNGVKTVWTASGLAGLTIQRMDTGTDFTCVIASKKILCWGANNVGQLGNGITINSNIPTFSDKSTSSDLSIVTTINSNSAPFGMVNF